MTLGPMIVEQLSVILIHNYPLAKGGIEFVITLASVGCSLTFMYVYTKNNSALSATAAQLNYVVYGIRTISGGDL